MTPSDFRMNVKSYCEATSASETSGFRTAKHNANVGGCKHSPHLVGLGEDVTYDDIPELSERQRIANFFGLAVIPEKDHDHLQPLMYPACPTTAPSGG